MQGMRRVGSPLSFSQPPPHTLSRRHPRRCSLKGPTSPTAQIGHPCNTRAKATHTPPNKHHTPLRSNTQARPMIALTAVMAYSEGWAVAGKLGSKLTTASPKQATPNGPPNSPGSPEPHSTRSGQQAQQCRPSAVTHTSSCCTTHTLRVHGNYIYACMLACKLA